ncbi:hypothetical protein Pcinc_009647 [Petrolisthes cinctipes]|uniref:Uncharacterized protein n=1 Tax=Petrolisthes cinctipes TaxID=88211 RepID=A0AAE1G703_PETCI|nr:hypothetical protein Pcinc_009647 [Petrolisthes cinctipes]
MKEIVLVSVILVAVIGAAAGEHEGCGCWGSDRVFVQDKAPITGWFNLSKTIPYSYERRLTIARHGEVVYSLQYNLRRGFWVLSEQIINSFVISSNRRTLEIEVLCPGQCACRQISVDLTSINKTSMCLVIIGNYHQEDRQADPQSPNTNCSHSTTIRPNLQLPTETRSVTPMTKLQKSSCLLKSLARCLKHQELEEIPKVANVENACSEYARVLSSNYTKPPPIQYIMKAQKNYTLTPSTDGDFWWIVSKDDVYAVSSEGGPCPDHLPEGNTWQLVSHTQPESQGEPLIIDGPQLNITCGDNDGSTSQ